MYNSASHEKISMPREKISASHEKISAPRETGGRHEVVKVQEVQEVQEVQDKKLL